VNYAIKSSFVNTVLESLPDVANKLKEPHSQKESTFDDAVNAAQAGVAIVLIY
jgi:CRISPR/Cas system endoribonuclease Cas6 (RAMP superfamily)